MSINLHPSITVNGENFVGNYRNTNELFKKICSKIKDRPEECKEKGLAEEKDRIKKEYQQTWGDKGSPERAVITFDKIKEEQKKEQDAKAIHARTTRKLDLVLVIIALSIATAAVFYWKNYREKGRSE